MTRPALGGTLSVRPSALASNARLVRAAARPGIAAVVKGDGYGLGAQECAEAFWQAGIRDFYVGNGPEGRRVKRAVPESRVRVLPGPAPARTDDFPELEWILGRSALQGPLGPSISIEVDGGTGRGGVALSDLHRLIEALPRSTVVRELSAHFPRDVPAECAARAVEILERASDTRRIGTVSLGGGDVLSWDLDLPEHWLVRVGRLLYGIPSRAPTPPGAHVAVAFGWSASGRAATPVASIGYGAEAPPAGVPLHVGVGFAHGMPAPAVGTWQVLAGGHRYEIAHVAMLSSVAYPVAEGLPEGAEVDVVLLGQGDAGSVSVRETAARLRMPTSSLLVGIRPAARTYGEEPQ
ncbi:alanine racemase [Cellulomonas palmilytica]|uniref:alanine racemase n=1 Tax=Cellulomonas palmilytica TaxID=2608402 RepID=UPI001F2B2994|nr:alanine racemase [Cellulomonas palmilytica]UJP40675.1 alanine racemase [Cellulomonas palmilytica]